MAFLSASDLFDCWNLHFFSPAIYLIAGTGDNNIGTTDRRFELHSPLSLVSKKVRGLRHSQSLTEHVCISDSVGSETFLEKRDGLKLECFGEILEQLVWL